MGIIDELKVYARILGYKRKRHQFKSTRHEEWRTAATEIAPSHYKNNLRNLTFDDTIATYFVGGVTRHGITGLPEQVSTTLMDDLMNIEIGDYAIGLTTAVIPIPNYEAAKALQHAENEVIGNQKIEKDANESSYVSADTWEDLNDVKKSIGKIHRQEEKMFGQAFIVSILAEDPDSMKTAVGHVKQVLGHKFVRVEEPTGMMELAMQTALPFPVIPEKFQGDPLSNTAATFLAATNVNSHSDDRGLRLGYRKGDPSQQITVDLEKLPAMHAIFVGQTGGGKTTAVLAYAYRLFTELGYNFVIITAKKDDKTNQQNVAKKAGKDGAIINIGPEEQSVNPLQIVYDEENVGNTPHSWANLVHEQINTVIQFFSVFLEDGMSAPKRSYINRTMIELYEKYGIFVDRPETLKEALRTVEYPLMENLIEIWEKDLKPGLGGDLQKTVYSMINNTYQLGRKGAFSWINRASNIDISKKLIVIDVSSIKDAKMREAMNVFVTRIIWQKFRTGKKDKPYTIIAIDEAREFFKNPTTRDAIIDQLTQARTDKVGIWLMTQQPQDIIKSGVWEEVMNNTFVKVVFGPDKDESKVAALAKHFDFNEADTNAWISCSTGQAMILIRGKKTPVDIHLTKYELAMIRGDNFGSRNGTENQSTAIGNPIDERVRKLVEENGICVASWIKENKEIDDDFSGDAEDYFSKLEWERRTFTSAIGSGKVKAWVRQGLIWNGKVGSQSETHYTTVMQIAGYLMLKDVPETVVQHTDGVDISTCIGEELVAFEVEMPGSHTGDQLRKKQERAEYEYSICYFIGTSENVKFLGREVISQNVFQRGVNLRLLLDTIIEMRT